MTIYAADRDEVARRVGSRDITTVERVAETAEVPLGTDQRQALAALLNREYTRHPRTLEHDSAPHLIRAFGRLCRLSSSASTTVEMYDDPDATPVLWNFIWSDWDGADMLALPLSPYGNPAVTWHGPQLTAKFRAEFTAWRSGGSLDETYLMGYELDSIIDILGTAEEQGRGVFVFYEE